MRDFHFWVLTEDKQLEAVDVDGLAVWLEGLGADLEQIRRVDKTTVGTSVISTVFLIGSVVESGAGPFETMVFGGPRDGYQRSYSDWTEAQEGHTALVTVIERELADEESKEL